MQETYKFHSLLVKESDQIPQNVSVWRLQQYSPLTDSELHATLSDMFFKVVEPSWRRTLGSVQMDVIRLSTESCAHLFV